MCIGQAFATMEPHLVLATLMEQVRFQLVPGQRIVPEPLVTLRPKGGLKMRVERRLVTS